MTPASQRCLAQVVGAGREVGEAALRGTPTGCQSERVRGQGGAVEGEGGIAAGCLLDNGQTGPFGIDEGTGRLFARIKRDRIGTAAIRARGARQVPAARHRFADGVGARAQVTEAPLGQTVGCLQAKAAQIAREGEARIAPDGALNNGDAAQARIDEGAGHVFAGGQADAARAAAIRAGRAALHPAGRDGRTDGVGTWLQGGEGSAGRAARRAQAEGPELRAREGKAAVAAHRALLDHQGVLLEVDEDTGDTLARTQGQATRALTVGADRVGHAGRPATGHGLGDAVAARRQVGEALLLGAVAGVQLERAKLRAGEGETTVAAHRPLDDDDGVQLCVFEVAANRLTRLHIDGRRARRPVHRRRRGAAAVVARQVAQLPARRHVDLRHDVLTRHHIQEGMSHRG